MNGLIGISILAAIPFFIIMLLVKLGFAAVCKHRESRTRTVIGIACFLSFLVFNVIEAIIHTIIYSNIHVEYFFISHHFLSDLILIIPVIIVTFLLEGFIYSKFAPSIKHPFYFALAMNAFLWFFIEALTLILDKVNI